MKKRLVDSTKRDFNRITINKTIKAKWNSHSYKFSEAIRAIIDELESNLTEDAAGETTNPPYIEEYLRKIVICCEVQSTPYIYFIRMANPPIPIHFIRILGEKLEAIDVEMGYTFQSFSHESP